MEMHDTSRRRATSHSTSHRNESDWIVSRRAFEWERDDDDDDITSSSIGNGIELLCGGAQLSGGRNKCQDFPNRQIKLKTRPNGKSLSLRWGVRWDRRILQRMDGHIRCLPGMIVEHGKDYPDKQWSNWQRIQSIWVMWIPEMHITCWSYLCHAPVWGPGTNDWWLTSGSLYVSDSVCVCVCVFVNLAACQLIMHNIAAPHRALCPPPTYPPLSCLACVYTP